MVNIIISRKGFDSAAGGCASPIMPDGKNMVSIPIPDHYFDRWDYQSLNEQYTGRSYRQIVSELRPKCLSCMDHCHLDPDINLALHPEKDWTPVFGQVGTAETILENNGVEVGDIFLFFGWFRGTVEGDEGMRYTTKNDDMDFFHTSDIHAIFGHLEIKEIVRDADEMKERFPWHPHVGRHEMSNNSGNNTMYVGDRKTTGTFGYDEKRVLTKIGCTRSKWDANKLSWMLKDLDSMNKKPVINNDTICFRGRWQELVIRDASEDCLDWVGEILNN